MYRRLALATVTLALLAAASTGASAAGPSSPSAQPEHPYRAPHHPDVYPTDQLHVITRATARTATGGGTTGAPAPFLTRPYWGPRSVNSLFDHCLSNGYYVADGKICADDGTVALKSNGVDPNFPLGYAATPGKTDYVYYDGHNGWDLGLPEHTPVLAAADGTVTYAAWDNYGWGNTILINHGNGFSTRYAHLEAPLGVVVNQQVVRGQQLGFSGTTGNSTGPHLHFGVYRNDVTLPNGDMVAIDPWGWQSTTSADPWPYDEGDLWLTGNPTDPAPQAPTGVSATVQCGGVVVSWSSPSFNGGDGITFYTITATPGGATEAVDANRTAALFPGLTAGTGYTFTVAASSSAGTGPDSAATTQVTAPPPSDADNSCHLYVLSGYGVLHPAGVSPTLTDTLDFGWDIARSFAVFPGGSGGYILDGWGGLHAVGSAQAVAPPAYWQGWDIARSIALAPWATPAAPAGWVLDGWGSIHEFGGAPPIKSPGYWPGWDIARQLAIEPDSTATSVSGYMLDGWGGLHAFGKAPAVRSTYWQGWDIARGLTLLPGSTTAAPAGYTLDGWGGVHPFGSAASVQITAYWPHWDIARGITAWSAGPSGQPGGWVLDGWGGLHPFGSAPPVSGSAYWSGWDIARGLAGAGQSGRGT